MTLLRGHIWSHALQTEGQLDSERTYSQHDSTNDESPKYSWNKIYWICYDTIDNFKKTIILLWTKQNNCVSITQFSTLKDICFVYFNLTGKQSKTYTSYLLLLQHELHWPVTRDHLKQSISVDLLQNNKSKAIEDEIYSNRNACFDIATATTTTTTTTTICIQLPLHNHHTL